MDKVKLEELQNKFAGRIDTQVAKAIAVDGDELLIPTGEFEALTKARNEQMKQENESKRIEMEQARAEMEAKAAAEKLAFEQIKHEAEMELETERVNLEREKLLMEAELAKQKNEAELEKAYIDAAATEKRSKRELIGRIFDFLKGLLVAILGLAVGIYQVNGIRREEENDTFVNSKSLQFWTRGNTKG